MRMLLLGYSSIARRRIIPALRRLNIQELDIASVSSDAPDGFEGRWFRDYHHALAESDAQVVYVSTTNNLHGPLAVQALQRGFHVVVDKPACASLAEAQNLVEIAMSAGRCVAEATVYGYHPQVLKAVDLFEGRATRLLAAFNVPPFPASNYRYRPELGGGADLDIGPYAVTPGRLFFNVASLEIEARVLSEQQGVITSFSIISLYPEGRCLTGTFGFTTSYVNQLQILSSDLNIRMERTFSPPPDMGLELQVRENNQNQTLGIAAADSFGRFLHSIFLAIGSGDFKSFGQTLLFDAQELEALRTALERSRQKGA